MFRNFQVAAIALITGCATNPSQVVSPRCNLQDDCFDRDRVRSFEFLDRDTLVLEVGPNRCPFLLEVDGINCSAVFASRLTFYDNDRRICAFDNALLVTDIFLRNDPLDACRIRDVRAVSEDELLERYASLGKIPPLPPVGSGEIQVREGSDATGPDGGDAGSDESGETPIDPAPIDPAAVENPGELQE